MAKSYCETFRALMPQIYNERLQYDQPIPSLNASTTSDASNVDANASVSAEHDRQNSIGEQLDETDNDVEDAVDNEPTENAQSEDADNTVSESIVAIHSLNASTTFDAINMESFASASAENDRQDSNVEESFGTDNYDVDAVDNGPTENAQSTIAAAEQSVIVAESHDSEANNNTDAETDFNVTQSTHGTENNVKHVLKPVNMHADDENAIRNLFGDHGQSVEANDNNDLSADSIATVSLSHGETAEMIDGKIIVTRKLDDSLEMAYTFGETPTPLKPQYKIKINDLISGNIPFKENEEKDRAYFVKIDNRFEEITMASVLLNGLKCLNDGENRKQSGLDNAFIKALIIGLCTTQAIKDGMQIHKDLKIFIKGINIFVHSIF